MGMSVLSFLKKRYVNFLLAYLALLTNIFMLDNYTGFIYGRDLAIFINFILLLYMIIEKIQFSNYHFGKKALLIPKSIFRDTGFIIISIWIGFYLFEFLLFSGRLMFPYRCTPDILTDSDQAPDRFFYLSQVLRMFSD